MKKDKSKQLQKAGKKETALIRQLEKHTQASLSKFETRLCIQRYIPLKNNTLQKIICCFGQRWDRIKYPHEPKSWITFLKKTQIHEEAFFPVESRFLTSFSSLVSPAYSLLARVCAAGIGSIYQNNFQFYKK